MDLIKKNWGILLCTLVFLVALSFLLLRTFQYSKAYDESKKEIESQQAWFDTLNKDGWKVTKGNNGELENAIIAEQNRQIAVGHYNNLKMELYKRFSFEPEIPQNSTRAADMLDAKLSQITDLALVTYKMDFQDTIGGKLAEINEGTEPLVEEDFKPIFRQLMIYEQLVNHLGRAGVKTVSLLDFPRSLQVEEDGDHTITPIVINFQAPSLVVQTLLNNLTNDRHMLFFIRNISFEATTIDQPQQEFSQIALLRRQMLDTKKAEKLGRGNGQNGMTGGREASSARSSRSGRRGDKGTGDMGGKSSKRTKRGERGMENGMGRGGRAMAGGGNMMDGLQNLLNIDDALLAWEDPKRQDNLIFRTPRPIDVELTLDLIEFTAPEEETASEEAPASEVEE